MSDFDQLMRTRYADRGGWRLLNEIFAAKLPYDMKLNEASKQYRISRSQAVRWYGRWRQTVGLKDEG